MAAKDCRHNKVSVEVGAFLDGQVWVRIPLTYDSIDEAQQTLRAAANQFDLLRIDAE